MGIAIIGSSSRVSVHSGLVIVVRYTEYEDNRIPFRCYVQSCPFRDVFHNRNVDGRSKYERHVPDLPCEKLYNLGSYWLDVRSKLDQRCMEPGSRVCNKRVLIAFKLLDQLI